MTRIQDEVYVQVSDLVTESRIFGADIYYYKFRLESYLRKFVRSEKMKNRTKILYLEETESIKELRFGPLLSEIRDSNR